MAADRAFLALAYRLAEAQTGRTGENPAVGCVLVKNGVIIGRGATADGGRPHAERVALDQAGKAAKGATAYVTLEPCAHQGGTPPCADALVAAGIARVVCPWRDPNPKVDAQGFARLRAGGIAVDHLPCDLPDGQRYFFINQVLKRPFVALKLATSLDGRIALSNGESQWISGETARRYTRALRSRFHGIGVGVGTVLADDPKLTTRLAGLRNPRPVIFDQTGRTPKDASVFMGERAVMVSAQAQDYPNCDHVNTNPHALAEALPKLLEAGIASLLIEGGANLAASFVEAGLVDRIYHVATGALMGGDALSGLGALGLENMEAVPRGRLAARVNLGEDTLLRYDFDTLDLEPFLMASPAR